MKLSPSIFIFSLCLLNTSARCQHERYKTIDHLCSNADEILLVKVIEDKPDLWRSLTTCHSDVKGIVTEAFKVTKFSGTSNLEFRRMIHCADTLPFPIEKLLKTGRPYIVFLQSNLPDTYDYSNIGDIHYDLSDYILGIQELSDDLYEYLRWWQGNRERDRKK